MDRYRLQSECHKLRAKIWNMDDPEERVQAFYWSRGHIGESLKTASYEELVKLKGLLEYKLEHGHCPDHEKEPGEVRQKKRRGGARLQKTLRVNVMARDGAFCRTCQSTENLTLDHIVPLALGGANEEANLQMLCQPCHTKKNYTDARTTKANFFATKFPEKKYVPNGRRRAKVAALFLAVGIAAFSIGGGAEAEAAGKTSARTIERRVAKAAAPAVVMVNAYTETAVHARTRSGVRTTASRLQKYSIGSGFFVSADGYLLTNKHVVAEEDATYTVSIDGRSEVPATVIYRSPYTDLAVLKVKKKGRYDSLELGRSSTVMLGERTVGIGNALGKRVDSVSRGDVASLNAAIRVKDEETSAVTKLTGLIQTTAKIYPGDSGGPLLDLDGMVVGVTSAMGAKKNTPAAYAITADAARQALLEAGLSI